MISLVFAFQNPTYQLTDFAISWLASGIGFMVELIELFAQQARMRAFATAINTFKG
jgi:hypothetical protein